MSLTFYYCPMTTAEITNMVLAELDIPHEVIMIDLMKGETHSPDFLKLNPNGEVPVIVHDGVAISESAAITMYLGEIFGVSAKLYPASGPERGRAMTWITWSNVALADAGGRLACAMPEDTPGGIEQPFLDRLSPDQRSPDALKRAQADIDKLLKILDAQLAGQDFLLEHYSLADTHVNSIVSWLAMMNTDLSLYPHLSAWAKRCNERPAIVKLFAQHS